MPLDRIDGEIIFDIDYNSLHQVLQATGWLTGWVTTGNAGTLSVDVAAGRGTAEGVLKETGSSTNVVLTAADATNPRKDIIVYDTSAGALAKVDGTAAAIEPDGEDNPRKMKLPAPPDLGATDDILIAMVYVPAAATLGSQCTITDKRVKLPLVYVPSQAQGDLWFYDGKKIARLAPGTSGLFLQTLGAGANPAWVQAHYVNSGSYTGDGTLNRAIAHGLGVKPKLVSILLPARDYIQFISTERNGYIAYVGPTYGGELEVTTMNATYFYVGNATSYDQSANFDSQPHYWTAIY